MLILVRPSTSAPISRPEAAVDLLERRLGVLDRVVQDRRGDRRVVELEVGQDRRDLERMGEIGLARGALLQAMRLHGVDIGAVEEVLVGVGVVAAHPLDELVLPHHAAALGLGERALGRRRETADGRPCRCLGQRRLFQLNDWHISRILARAR